MTNAQLAHIRLRSATLLRLISVLTAALWLTFLLERFGAVSLKLAAHGSDATAWRAFVVQGVLGVPEVFFLLALGGVRRALAEFARGQLYVPAVTRMLDRVGVLLAAGAGIGVFAVPAMLRALGADPGYWIAFDVSAMVLGALGLSLTVIAHVFGRAAALEAELDEIF